LAIIPILATLRWVLAAMLSMLVGACAVGPTWPRGVMLDVFAPPPEIVAGFMAQEAEQAPTDWNRSLPK